MTEQEYIDKLHQEGYTKIKVVHMKPGETPGQHTHKRASVHIILSGELFITDEDGTKVYEKGDRVEFAPDTSHSAAVGTEDFAMVVGFK